MKFAELSESTLAKIKLARWDRIIEKHQGTERWSDDLEYNQLEFIEVEGKWILLPVDLEHHQNITILRTIWSENGKSVTLFLKDTTYDDNMFDSGYMAVGDRLQGEDFFLAILYHEWFIVNNPPAIFA